MKTAQIKVYDRHAASFPQVAAVLSFEAKKTISQIRAAGYTVAKAKIPQETIEDILKELGV